MNKKKEYVKPIHTENSSNRISLKEIYANLHPNYWKRKLPHLLIVIPTVWFIYIIALNLPFMDYVSGPELMAHFLEIILLIISVILTLISAVFYPYSLYWYKGSLIGQILNSIMYFGGCLTVILKIIATLLGGIVIAGVFSPIMGVLTWRKYKKRNVMIGEEIDFD